ncbi:PilZ domain-containing protein [Treponema sp.]|uniref:PilZ domain-containing protein n=1 Tax=Treponema sp. TaxID=166 RepID=UPI00298ECD59|nr:PilZ domain-containing protein [Treponema sp.]MCR5613150.1 PilZ domain-containing protein [Treponema sp.]
MNDAAGSPLAARQSPLAYMPIVYLLIAIGIIFMLFIIYKIIKKKHSTPEYIEKQKQKITTQKNIQDLAKKIQLSKEEVSLLTRICRDTQAKNIFYSYLDDEYLDSLFKAEYQKMIQSKKSDKDLYELFRLRFHIDKVVSFSRHITSSYNIPVGTILSYPAPSGFQYQFTLVKNEKNGLSLSVPEALEEGSQDRPEKLNKIAMIFSLQNGSQYAIVTRVVQFMKMPNGEDILLMTHSNTLCPQSRRSSKRFTVNRECKFSAVEVSQNAKGELSFKPKENKYEGTLVDLSEGGCKLYANLPIKKKQYIYLMFDILGKEEGVFGQIMDTRTDMETGIYAIHIAFKQLPLDAKVRLLADLYEYAGNS